jgi:SAM-dependent methyltransferase
MLEGMHSACTDTATLIRGMDAAESTPDAVAVRERSYELLRAARRVADVGCGTGRAVAELAGRGVAAFGVDLDPEMLVAARRRFPEIDVRPGDVADLPLEDGEVDGYRADKVFHNVPSPSAAVTEARRVLAPGGRIVLLGQDWDTIVIDADPRLGELTRRIVHARADTIRHPRIARAYRSLLIDGGFRDVELVVHTMIFTAVPVLTLLTQHATVARDAGAITADEAAEWIADQTTRARDGRLLMVMPIFLAAATR